MKSTEITLLSLNYSTRNALRVVWGASNQYHNTRFADAGGGQKKIRRNALTLRDILSAYHGLVLSESNGFSKGMSDELQRSRLSPGKEISRG